MRESSYIWSMGTELELRPVKAADYLKAAERAGTMTEKYAAGESEKDIIFGACIVEKSAYIGDEPAFRSAEDVLDKMTAEDILWAGGDYIDLRRSMQNPPYGAEQSAAEPTMKAGADGGETGAFAKETPISESVYAPDLPERPADVRPGETGDTVGESVPRDTAITYDVYPRIYSPGRSGAPDGGAQAGSYPEISVPDAFSAASAPDSMESVSGFFERESRRYDGNFERY